ncbi:hypothetical protein ABZ832_14480 [Streptantibioticus parmotrematis]|uniref:hypothetical protein n=1 Tax=Streptantibioticus parmotrematis TaxID=2873249 RepID=UPI0033C4984E
MVNNAKVGVALVGGYLLGRTKKARLAIGLGMFLAGRKISLDPQAIGKMVSESPLFEGLSAQARKQLVDATKSAATNALTNRVNLLADSLHERTLSLESGERPEADTESGSESEADEEPDRARDADEADEGEDEGGERRKARSGSSGARKTASKASSDTRKTASKTSRKASGTARKTASGTTRKTGTTARKTASSARKATSRGGSRG